MRGSARSALVLVAVVFGAVAYPTSQAPQLKQSAYLKASNPVEDAHFGCGGTLTGHAGNAMAISQDGTTMAIGAPHESSGAKGINGNQNDKSVYSAGAVYVFTKAGNSWAQQAYVKASNPMQSANFGSTIALSRDGNTMAVAAYYESSAATGINGNQDDRSIPEAGAVYVFTRTGTTWAQQAYVKSSMTRANVLFGYGVGLSANGDTLAVAEYDADRGKGALYVLTRTGGVWTHQARIQATNGEPQDSLGYSIAISEDGNTIAAGAADEDCLTPGVNPPGCDHDQSDNTSAGAAYVFVRDGATWTQQAFLKASNPGKEDWFGVRIAISGDGNTVAVGAPNEDSAAKGINGDMNDNSADEAGAVYVYTRSGTTWTQQAYVKPSNTRTEWEFGTSLALNRDGRILVAGARGEDSGAKGVNGNQNDHSVRGSGAAYVFTR